VFFAMRTIGTVPGLRDALLLLAEHGFDVDLYVRGDEPFPRPEFNDERVQVTSDRPGIFRQGPNQPQWMHRGFRPYSWVVGHVYHPVWRSQIFRRELRARHRDAPYRCVLALDSEALVDCARYADDLGVPMVFWSLELIFWSDIRSQAQLSLKTREVELSRECALVIVQDRWRGRALAEENGLDPSRMLFVPNAPRGAARRRPGDHLRRTLGIPPDRMVVLCSGALEPWASSLDLVEAAASWEDRFFLVMQSRRSLEDIPSHFVQQVLRAVHPGHAAILSDPVPMSAFRELVDSADIGVALYQPRGDGPDGPVDHNIELMGYASGKVSAYLHSGLPIITSDLVGLRDLVASSGCGMSVQRAGDVADALAEIANDYDAFVARACSGFDLQLELGKHFAPVLARITTL